MPRNDKRNRVFGTVIVIMIIVGGVLTAKVDDGALTLWDKLSIWMQQQLNWQPFTNTKEDIHIFVVSQNEMELLEQLISKCGFFWDCGEW